jgi:hypothetical protein
MEIIGKSHMINTRPSGKLTVTMARRWPGGKPPKPVPFVYPPGFGVKEALILREAQARLARGQTNYGNLQKTFDRLLAESQGVK